MLYRGIAARAFERRFQLADHVEVTGASLENGLLHIDLVREIPEAMKPRKIAIGKVRRQADRRQGGLTRAQQLRPELTAPRLVRGVFVSGAELGEERVDVLAAAWRRRRRAAP